MGKFKELSIDQSQEETALPPELKAVITIMASDSELVRKALPHVDIDRREINWDEIFQNDLGSGLTAAMSFAKAIWCDKVSTDSDPFANAFSMEPHLKSAILRGLAIRWGLA